MKNCLSARDFAAKFLDPWNAHDTQAVLASLPEDFEWQFTAGTIVLFDGDRLRSKRSYRKVVTPA